MALLTGNELELLPDADLAGFDVILTKMGSPSATDLLVAYKSHKDAQCKMT